MFSETIGQTPATTTQTRVPNGVNEYETIDLDGGGSLAPVSLQHDPAGNLTLDPLARNHDDPPGLALDTTHRASLGGRKAPVAAPRPPSCQGLGNETGQSYEYDEENRLIRVEPGGPPAEGDRKVEFAYDYLGRRIEKRVYTWDPNLAGGAGDWSPTPTLHRKFVWSGPPGAAPGLNGQVGVAGWLLLAELDGRLTGRLVDAELGKLPALRGVHGRAPEAAPG